MTWRREKTFILFWVMLFAVLVAVAMQYNAKARLAPLVIGIPGLVLAAAELVRILRNPDPEPVPGEPGETPVSLPEYRRREIAMFLWVGLLFGLIWVLGFQITIPVYTILFMRLRGRESWPLTLSLAAASWAFLHFLFIKLLGIELYPGLVPSALGLQL